MQKTRITFVLLLLILPFFRLRAQTAVDEYTAALLQQKLDSCVNTYDVPGISATLLLPGNRYWNGASGLSHIYTLAPMDTTLLFQEASVSKLFTATVIFQLIEEGSLSLNDEVGMYLSDIATIPSNTKIRYLLNQRSGIYNFIGQNPNAGDTWFSYPDSIWTPQLAIETYNDDPLFTQNGGFYYCNTNYILLGMIIEQITGHTFAEELRTRILEPYGLTQTFFPPTEDINGPLTTGWTSFTSLTGPFTTDASVMLNDCFASMVYTSGALVSCPKDVAKFTRLLFSGDILSQASLTQMKTCTNVNFSDGCNGYGYGTMRYTFNNKTWFGHAGDISGFTQLTIHQEQDSMTLTLSINRNNAPRNPIAAALIGSLVQALELGKLPAAASFHLSPNPANGEVHIEFSEAKEEKQLTLYNELGQAVYSEKLAEQVSSCTIPVDQLPGGIYFLHLSGEKTFGTQKLIIQH
ncbi:MAG: serine hydrolase [Bacteroidota bacterium]